MVVVQLRILVLRVQVEIKVETVSWEKQVQAESMVDKVLLVLLVLLVQLVIKV